MTSHYPEGFQKAKEFSELAMDTMVSHGIPATPRNFAIWYSYHAGSYGELIRGLQVMLDNGIEFTQVRNEEIYDKYFGFDREGQEIRDTGARIEAAVGVVLQRLGEAGRDTAEYGDKLADFNGDMANSSSSGQVRDLVQGILSETRQIMEKNQELERHLGDSAKQISELRDHLEEVRHEAMTDALTGISNRKFFDLRLREEVTAHMENGAALSLLMLDIDHFKKFNDTYGHRVGDEVLKVVGRVLRDGVKGRDAPTRYGGEEFAVILPQTCLEDAVTVGEHLRSNLAKRQIKNKKSGESYGTITISVGASQYRLGEPVGEFLQRADEALYRAKREGRNRVVAESETQDAISLAG